MDIPFEPVGGRLERTSDDDVLAAPSALIP
jgi:hypothetical protein